MATKTATATIGGSDPYGFDPPVGAISPDPFIVVIAGYDYQVDQIMDYGAGSGIEMTLTEEGGPVYNPDWQEISEVRLNHAGGTLILDTRDQSEGGDLLESGSSKGTGFLYYWFSLSGGIWAAGDVGSDYTVELDDTEVAAADYNQGTVVNTNRRNPGGGVVIPEAEYSSTQIVEIRGGSGRGEVVQGRGRGGNGGQVIVDLPPQAGTFDLDAHIEGYDFGSGSWYNILSGSNITAGSTRQRLKVAPFVNTVASQSANDLLPYLWRVRIEHGDATTVTYSVEYKLF